MNTLRELMAALPKAELHLHLEGSVMPLTLIELAAKNNIVLPEYAKPLDLYEFDKDLATFLNVYNLVCESIVDHQDFERVTYECLANCHMNGARYVELFFSPQAHFKYGVSYATCLNGVVAGKNRAFENFGIECQLIPGVNREKPADENLAFLRTILNTQRDKVVGIGLDYYENPFPPELHLETFQLAKEQGLRLTAHAGEAGPAENVQKSVDILGCERIDHGYHIVDCPDMLAEFSKGDIVFTVCPSTTTITTHWHDLADPQHAIKRMVEGGLKVMINSDDPPMMGTDLANEYVLLVEEMGFSLSDIKGFILNGIDAAWISEDKKAYWHKEWAKEIDDLFSKYTTNVQSSMAQSNSGGLVNHDQ
ncbi:MAG: adenosine deaminase [Paraglaciecola sp.]|uniref:adenosine deaminase n=1 Tax=Paraglaciecola sp. TaxID=1920173 RepID=UPI003266CA2D